MDLAFVFITIIGAFWSGEVANKGEIIEATSYLLASFISILILVGSLALKSGV